MRCGLIGASCSLTPNGASAFSTAAMIAAIAGIVPPSPAPFDAERIERRRRLDVVDLDARHVGRDRQQILGEIGVSGCALSS